MKLSYTLPLIALVALVSGCKKGPGDVELARLGEAAPKFASDPKLSTIDAFLIGTWTTKDYLDPIFAKQLGLGSLLEDPTESAGKPVDEVYEFKAGGAFTVDLKSSKMKLTGTWSMANNQINLQYVTLNGDPVQVAREKIVKAAEGGTRGAIRNELVSDWLVSALEKQTTLVVASDTKLLVFSSSQPMPGMDGQIPTNVGGLALERLGPKAE